MRFLQVKALLQKAEDVDAIIQAVPELSDPVALSRSLAFLASSFPNKDPVLLLQVGRGLVLEGGKGSYWHWYVHCEAEGGVKGRAGVCWKEGRGCVCHSAAVTTSIAAG